MTQVNGMKDAIRQMTYFLNDPMVSFLFQKHPPRGVLGKRCSENMKPNSGFAVVKKVCVFFYTAPKCIFKIFKITLKYSEHHRKNYSKIKSFKKFNNRL